MLNVAGMIKDWAYYLIYARTKYKCNRLNRTTAKRNENVRARNCFPIKSTKLKKRKRKEEVQTTSSLHKFVQLANHIRKHLNVVVSSFECKTNTFTRLLATKKTTKNYQNSINEHISERNLGPCFLIRIEACGKVAKRERARAREKGKERQEWTT